MTQHIYRLLLYLTDTRQEDSTLRKPVSSFHTSPESLRDRMPNSKQRPNPDERLREDGALIQASPNLSTHMRVGPHDIAAIVGSPENIASSYFSTSSKFDGYHVVLDDGTLKRRTVSLSTLYDVPVGLQSTNSNTSLR